LPKLQLAEVKILACDANNAPVFRFKPIGIKGNEGEQQKMDKDRNHKRLRSRGPQLQFRTLIQKHFGNYKLGRSAKM
jgi:hypothetical protein